MEDTSSLAPMRLFKIFLTFLLLITSYAAASDTAQSSPVADKLKALVQECKQDSKGPFQGIRWFCPDGSVRLAQDRCSERGGIQHGLLKDEFQMLGREQGLYLGQVLAGTRTADFWDAEHAASRCKQYLLEKYLQQVDDGWILQQARYYRGAYQVEDELAWGHAFLLDLLGQDDLVANQYFLLRELARDIPHAALDTSRADRVRALSTQLALQNARFGELRAKIHGQPEASDADRVAEFRQQHSELGRGQTEKLERLEAEIHSLYDRPLFKLVQTQRPALAVLPELLANLDALLSEDVHISTGSQCLQASKLLWMIREEMPRVTADSRLVLLDVSRALEDDLYTRAPEWQPSTLIALHAKTLALAQAMAACGYLELWEWREILPKLQEPSALTALNVDELEDWLRHSERMLDWSSRMFNAHYQTVTERFAEFEPLATQYLDHRIRSSVIFPYGQTVQQLASEWNRYAGLRHELLDSGTPEGVRGMQPGYAVGILRVVTDAAHVDFDPKSIYVLGDIPIDIKPVAGILSARAGNPVSHVQLLARNLGIPGAIIPLRLVTDWLPYNGESVFFAVSPKGRVLLKRQSAMSAEEKSLVEKKQKIRNSITVPTTALDLRRISMIPLDELRAKDAGIWCGPKAANLGELKFLFPEHVALGFVIPFGVFKAHLQQAMPAQDLSYWQYLEETFRLYPPQAENDAHVLQRLDELHDVIRQIPLLPAFQYQLKEQFPRSFGTALGSPNVFVRSDTNMEDLKDFTGAGLNLTVPNVHQTDLILQAIRDVWSSPYTDRSYHWRQQYVTNPEAVYPSILVLQSVPVEKSGVLVTAGLDGGEIQDITIAFNHGTGGAVDGQAAESWRMTPEGHAELLSPGRECLANRLSPDGGVEKNLVLFNAPILSANELQELKTLSITLHKRLPKMGHSGGPYDVELGFLNGQLWLFQVRPYVENKNAKRNHYLKMLDQGFRRSTRIPMHAEIKLPDE